VRTTRIREPPTSYTGVSRWVRCRRMRSCARRVTNQASHCPTACAAGTARHHTVAHTPSCQHGNSDACRSIYYDAGTPAPRHPARAHAGRVMCSLTLLLLLSYRVCARCFCGAQSPRAATACAVVDTVRFQYALSPRVSTGRSDTTASMWRRRGVHDIRPHRGTRQLRSQQFTAARCHDVDCRALPQLPVPVSRRICDNRLRRRA